MNLKETLKRKENCIAALVFSVLLAVITGLFFDYYFALNDDMLMKDIVAGIYTGTPTGYNIQMLYPLCWAISLLYRLVRTVPWYSLFFLFCQFGCIYLIKRDCPSGRSGIACDPASFRACFCAVHGNGGIACRYGGIPFLYGARSGVCEGFP